MTTTKKSAARRDDRGGSLLLAVLASPLGWIADDRPVALRDRHPHGDEADSLTAQVSAALWGLALLVVAVVAPTWWAPIAIVAVLVLVLPARTAARRGGVMVVPTDEDRGAPGRLAVTAWAIGLGRAVSYALVDRREGDPEGVRGRRARRLRALLGVVVPTGLLSLDAHLHGALSGHLAPLWGVRVILTDDLTLTIDAGLLGRLVLALVVIGTLSGSTRALGRYHAEDLQLTGTPRYPGMSARLAAALGVSVSAFDLDSELHWNSPRARGEGFHARTISGPVAAALLKPEARERVGALFPEWELTEWDHRSFRLAPATDAERARRENLQSMEGLVEGITGESADGVADGEPIALDTDDVDWEED
jgi:hypothetical protein